MKAPIVALLVFAFLQPPALLVTHARARITRDGGREQSEHGGRTGGLPTSGAYFALTGER